MDKRFSPGMLLLALSIFSVWPVVAGTSSGPEKGTMDITGQQVHLQQIPILGYQMNTEVRAQPTRNASTVALSDITVTKEVDRNSPQLAKVVNTGGRLTQVTLKFYKADDHNKYAQLTLTQVSIVKITRSQGEHVNGQPTRETEQLTLHFAGVRIEYYSTPTNSKLNEKWDLQKATSI